MNESTNKRLEELIALQLEGGLNTADEKELNFILLSSDEARKLHLNQCQLHGMLLEERELLESISDERSAKNVISMFNTNEERNRTKRSYLKWVSMISGTAATILFLFILMDVKPALDQESPAHPEKTALEVYEQTVASLPATGSRDRPATKVSANKDATIRFNRDIRPILSDNCFHCHGPDKETRAANLRLDSQEGILSDLGNGVKAIVPGDPENSEVYKRITSSNKGALMPPEKSHKHLDSAQITLFKNWIAQGATWENHWSFNPIVQPKVPSIRNQAWVSNPIDSFIMARLEQEGLSPTAEADKFTLVRRVSFDLRGLPPTAEEVEAYVKDVSPDAYEKMVDRFLASDQFGQHRARYWLDAARYSDSHGYHLDNYRSIWPYRDWVVNAFNENMPFDQFTVEQLAGDLLPNASQSQKIATGFNRCNPTTSEGGAIAEEYLAIYAQDRVEATSTVWLGLTMGCASCHDHKFDPLSQQNFYEMTAFFRNTTQAAMDKNIYDTPPALRVYDAGEQVRVDTLAPEVEELKWQMDGLKLVTSNSVELAAGNTDWLAEDVLWPENDSYGNFEKNKPFSMSFWIYIPTNELKNNIALFGKYDPLAEKQGWSAQLLKNKKLELLFKSEPATAQQLKFSADVVLTTNAWNHVVISYNAFYQFDRAANFSSVFDVRLNGTKIKAEGVGNKTYIYRDFQTDQPYRMELAEDHESGVKLSDLRLYDGMLTLPEKVLLASDRISDAVSLTNAPPKKAPVLPEREQLKSKLAEYRILERELAELKHQASVTLIMEEKKDSRPFAHILNRGQYDQPGDKVFPNMPTALPPLPEGASTNRLTLANWLVQPNNPLPARVTVNRFWQEIFGIGIVKTAEDFGSQGEPPSHPELLDWLAAEFIDSGWDVKHLYKTLLMSSTYRQSSTVSPIKLEVDPDNRLLARGARYRLDAEVIRDQALYLSGLMADKRGGPPVKPYQPAGVWKAVAYTGSNLQDFVPDHGESLYCRSLYTLWKRTAPPPSMAIFDAPSRESCSVRRERTNTPLQALVLLNDPQHVEAARNLAQRILRSPDKNRFRFLLALALGYEPEQQSTAILKKTYDDILPHYKNNVAAANQLLEIGESGFDSSLDRAELAAWTVIASQVMNMDAFITKN